VAQPDDGEQELVSVFQFEGMPAAGGSIATGSIALSSQGGQQERDDVLGQDVELLETQRLSGKPGRS
jgi:hypothetical protein